MIYNKKDNDTKYRLLSLSTSSIPPFRAFDNPEVAYTEDQVIEVESNNGKSNIYYDYPKLDRNGILWAKSPSMEGSRVTISTEISLARLWVSVNGALYKIPATLPVENGSYYFTMSLGQNNFDIEGDKYFKAACEFAD